MVINTDELKINEYEKYIYINICVYAYISLVEQQVLFFRDGGQFSNFREIG